MKNILNLATKTGISITTIFTVFLFGSGFFYWTGYLEHFNLNPWIANVPHLQVIYPRHFLVIVLIYAFSVFFYLRFREKKNRDESLQYQFHEELEKYLRKNNINLSDITAFEKSPYKEKLQILVLNNIDRFLPILKEKKITDFCSFPREELLKLSPEQNNMEVICVLSNEEYKGFCWFLFKIRCEFIVDSDVKEIKGIANKISTINTNIEKTYKIGTLELICSIFFGLFFCFTIYSNLSNGNYIPLSSIALGIVLGLLIFYGIKFKQPDLKISMLIVPIVILSIYCYFMGKIDATKPLNKIFIISSNETELKCYGLILYNKEGVYVIDEIKNNNSTYQITKFIKIDAIKQIMFAPFIENKR